MHTSIGTIQGTAGQVNFELRFDGKPHGSFDVILQIELRKKRDQHSGKSAASTGTHRALVQVIACGEIMGRIEDHV